MNKGQKIINYESDDEKQLSRDDFFGDDIEGDISDSLDKILGDDFFHPDMIKGEDYINKLDDDPISNIDELFCDSIFEGIEDEKTIYLEKVNEKLLLTNENDKKISEEEKILRWKLVIEGNSEKLKKEFNIVLKNGVWYFGDAKGSQSWRKYFRNFPNAGFNKKKGLGNERGHIENLPDLKELFEFMGLTVATKDEEVLRWKGIIEGYKNVLKKESNIYMEEGVRNFSNVKKGQPWRKYFRTFPNATFNKKYRLGNNRGMIECIKDLERSLIFFDDYK